MNNLFSIGTFNIYRIKSVLKVEISIIASITVSLIGQAVVKVIKYVETSKTDIIVFIDSIIMCLLSHWPIIFRGDNLTILSHWWHNYVDVKDDFVFSYLTDISYFPLIFIPKCCRTRSDQVSNGPFKEFTDIFTYFSIGFQLLYCLFRIILEL